MLLGGLYVSIEAPMASPTKQVIYHDDYSFERSRFRAGLPASEGGLVQRCRYGRAITMADIRMMNRLRTNKTDQFDDFQDARDNTQQ